MSPDVEERDGMSSKSAFVNYSCYLGKGSTSYAVWNEFQQKHIRVRGWDQEEAYRKFSDSNVLVTGL